VTLNLLIQIKQSPHNDEDALAQVKLKETPMPTTSERTTNNQKLTNKDEQANGQTLSALNPNKYSDEGETQNFNRNAVKDGSNNTYTNRMGKRRKAYDEEEEDGDNRRRRRPAQLPLNQQKKSTPSII
jgi:selenocysteine-specific translation elongation factor